MRLVAELRDSPVFCPAVLATIASSLALYEIVKSKSYVEAAASIGAGTKEEWMGLWVFLRYVLLIFNLVNLKWQFFCE
jgi:hypothetical protein